MGAGPAGTACAATLHELGHLVTVVDKAVFPRDKCCGDGLTTNALRVLESLHFNPARVADWQECTDIEMHTPSGTSFDLSLPKAQGMYAAIAPRIQLDHALVEHCRELGISVHEGHAFLSVISDTDTAITVSIENMEDITVDYVIAADGMWSPVRKSLGLSTPGYLGEWHAFRQYISNVSGSASKKLHIWFDKDLLPGYAWSFPLPNNRANFGFGILRNDKRSTKFMNELWADLLHRPHIKEALGEGFTPEDRHTAWPIPARITSAPRSAGRVLFVGDAVCATDVLTGEGIGQALETGIAAAHAIDQCVSPQDVRKKYSDLLDKTLVADHKMSDVLGKLLTRPRIASIVLSLVNTNDWTRRNFVRWMFEDEPRAIIFTPRRWHKHFLSQKGAYQNQSSS